MQPNKTRTHASTGIHFTFDNQHSKIFKTKFQQLRELFVWYTHVTIIIVTIHLGRPFLPFRLVTWTRFCSKNRKPTTVLIFLKVIKRNVFDKGKKNRLRMKLQKIIYTQT